MDGFGVNIRRLFGGDSWAALRAAVGKRIRELSLDDDRITMRMEDNSGIVIRDMGRSCCESRYMCTDDDLAAFKGATLLDANIKSAADALREPDDYGYHEMQFFELQTDQGIATFCSHNEHNGYYGGFALESEVAP